MKKDWLWDKNISENKLKEIFADKNNLRFISLTALLLSRKNSAEEVFKEYIKREDFFVRWHSIKKRMRKNSWNDQRIEYWQAIYDTLKKIPAIVELRQKEFKELPFALSREIAEQIREEREKLGLTQKNLADKLDISQQIISRVESGKHNISLATLNKIYQKLGISLTVKKFGFTEDKPVVTSTKHILAFCNLPPDRFEDMCLWIIQRSKEFDKVEKYGGTNDKQRDIVAYKYNIVGKREMWYFQCKRYANISFAVFKKEIDNIKKHSDIERCFRPDKIVFVVGCRVSSGCKDKVEEYAKKLSFGFIEFWDEAKLDEKANVVDGVVEEFFGGDINTEKIAQKVADKVDVRLSERFQRILAVSESDSIRTDDINKKIDEAVKLMKVNNIEAAKDSLFNILGNIEINKTKYTNELVRIYNNLGVCFNRLPNEGGDFDKAKEYFESALKINPNFNKARANLASVFLNMGGKDNFTKAYSISQKVWDESDKKEPLFFQIFIWAIYHDQSSQAVIDYYEKSAEAKSLVIGNEQLLSLMGTIYLEKQCFKEAEEFADLTLGLSPNSPQNLSLKARILMGRSQKNKIIPLLFEVVPKFQDCDEIEKAFKLLKQALEIVKNENNRFLENQINIDILICSVWLRQASEAQYKFIRESIDLSRLTQAQIRQLRIQDFIVELERRNFETAHNKLIQSPEWDEITCKEKFRIAHIFLLQGAPEQSKDVMKGLQSWADQEKNMQFWIDMSLNEVLLENKNLAIKAAEKVKNFSIGTDKEKIGFLHFNAIMLRYGSAEVDRLMDGMFDYDKKYPEDKAIWPVKAIDERGELLDEFKTMLLKQKEWYENVRQEFRIQPVPSYYLEKILRRPYAQILSFQNDPEFMIELTIPNEQFEKGLLDNFEKAEQLVFDYASLLNLSKMNLLGNLDKLAKKIYISQTLFDKIQSELLTFEQEDLRRLWHFLRNSKEIKIEERSKYLLKGEKIDKLFDEWLIDSMKLAKGKTAVFVVDDLRLLRFLPSEDIKGCNSHIILKAMRAKEWIDDKMYSLSIGDLAERFYTFLPFSGDDLFQIVMEDKSKITLRSYHLINQLLLSGSIADSFTKVFVKFIDLLWRTGSVPEDKVKWLSFFSEKILEFIDKQGGVDNNQELERVAPDFVQIWITAVQRSNRDETALLEKETDIVLAKPYLAIFKDNITRFIQAKNKNLTSK